MSLRWLLQWIAQLGKVTVFLIFASFLPYGITEYRQSCLDSFDICLLSIYCIPFILCLKDRAVTRKGNNYCPLDAYILFTR